MNDLRKPAKQAWQESEQKLQTECAKWLKKELYLRGEKQLFYHVPNESKASIGYRMKMKAQGVLSGVSDIVLPLRSQEYSGIYCEIKAKSGCPDADQKEFLNGVEEEGFLAVVINDLETFKKVFSYYLDQRKC